jgi:RPA family protein
MSGREPAWRVFAHEFQASIEEEKGTGERAASYLLSPIGARMNRVLVVGTLAPPEPIGRDPSTPFLRSRLTDPTGGFQVTAGGFQPRALAALQAIKQPQRTVVVGKAHLFHGRDEVAHGSIRAEALRPIDEGEYRASLADALRHTARRIDLSVRVRAHTSAADSQEALDDGIPPHWVRAARLSMERYPSTDPESFRGPLSMVLQAVRGREATTPEPPRPATPTGRVTVTRTPIAPPSAPVSSAVRAEEASFLDIVDDLSERSVDGYADLKEALALAEQGGVGSDRAEELLNRLEEGGVLEEPIVGKVRRA